MASLRILAAAVVGALIAAQAPTHADAREVKIGILAPFTGPFAVWGSQYKQAIELFLDERGTKVGENGVTLIYRDTTSQPEVGKRLAQEMITRDKVDAIAGLALTPEALAIAPVVTEANMPTVLFNSGTHFVTRKSPMFVRVSFTLDMGILPVTAWAAQEGVKTGIVAVSDYVPGQEALKTYSEEFGKHGITLVDGVKIPVDAKDFSPYLQKIKDEKPDGVFLFLAVGPPAIGFMKTYAQLGLKEAGIKLYGLAEYTEVDLPSIGDAALGAVSAWHYSAMHDSAKNRAFREALAKKFPGAVPDTASVSAYDGMHVVYEMIARTEGRMGPAAVEAVKGMAWESPRGPMSIDPKERDVIENIYIRRVVKKDGMLFDEEIKTFPDVKDPWKAAHPE
jgi:branched-chain amino acid transport system substrate-binding protein